MSQLLGLLLAGVLAHAPIGQPPPDPYAAILSLERARSLGGDRLAAFLASPDEKIAARAALAVGRTKQKSGAPLLEGYLEDKRPAVRAMTVYGLGLIGEGTAAGSISDKLLDDTSGAVRVAALDALERYESAKTLRDYELAACGNIVKTLHANKDGILRARAATALFPFADGACASKARNALVNAFTRERDDYVRWHIMWSIFRGYAPKVPLAFVTRALHDPSELVRIEAVRALGKWKGDKVALKAALATKNDASWRVQEQGYESSLGIQGKPVTQHLKTIASYVKLPPIAKDPLEHLAALPRTKAKGKLGAPTVPQAILQPKIDPVTSLDMASPAHGLHPRVRIVTTKGNLYLTLFPEWAPLTVANFLDLTNRGYYDGNPWFRIVPDFVVQTGDPQADENGDAGYTIGAEENPLQQPSYIVSMGLNYTNPPNAHAIRDSAGTQFYITLSPQLHLDEAFTVFGAVTSGADVLPHLIETDRMIRVERIPDEVL